MGRRWILFCHLGDGTKAAETPLLQLQGGVIPRQRWFLARRMSSTASVRRPAEMPAQCFCYNLRVVLMRCISNSAAGAANCAGDSNRRDTPRTRAGRAKSWRTKSAAPDYEKLGSFLPPSHAAQVFVHAWFRGAVGETRPLGRVPSLEKYRGRLAGGGGQRERAQCYGWA